MADQIKITERKTKYNNSNNWSMNDQHQHSHKYSLRNANTGNPEERTLEKTFKKKKRILSRRLKSRTMWASNAREPKVSYLRRRPIHTDTTSWCKTRLNLANERCPRSILSWRVPGEGSRWRHHAPGQGGQWPGCHDVYQAKVPGDGTTLQDRADNDQVAMTCTRRGFQVTAPRSRTGRAMTR